MTVGIGEVALGPGLGHRIGVTALLLGLGLEGGLGLADGPQAAFPGTQGLGQLVTAGIAIELVLSGVDRLGLFEDAGDLGLEDGLPLIHAAVAHGLVLARVRLDLRAIEGHPPERHQPGLLAQQQDVEEERMEGREVAAAELADGLVTRTGPAGEIHEADVGLQPLLELARTPDPGGIAIEEDLQHHGGVVGGHTPGLVMGREEGSQVEVVDEVADEGGQRVGIDPVPHRWRHQQERVLVVGPEGLGAHD